MAQVCQVIFGDTVDKNLRAGIKLLYKLKEIFVLESEGCWQVASGEYVVIWSQVASFVALQEKESGDTTSEGKNDLQI